MTALAWPELTGIPVLETERLVLRAPRPDDWPVFCAFAASDRTRYVGGAKTEPEAFQKFAAFMGHWMLRGFGRFILTRQGSHSPLGHIGPMQLSDAAMPELTWSLWTTEAEGKGYAFEAALAVNRWFFGMSGQAVARADVHADNAASHRIATRLGGRVWPDAPPGWFEHGTVYRFTAEGAA